MEHPVYHHTEVEVERPIYHHRDMEIELESPVIQHKAVEVEVAPPIIHKEAVAVEVAPPVIHHAAVAVEVEPPFVHHAAIDVDYESPHVHHTSHYWEDPHQYWDEPRHEDYDSYLAYKMHKFDHKHKLKLMKKHQHHSHHKLPHHHYSEPLPYWDQPAHPEYVPAPRMADVHMFEGPHHQFSHETAVEYEERAVPVKHDADVYHHFGFEEDYRHRKLIREQTKKEHEV